MFVPVSRFRRSLFDFDNLFGHALDLFDPFDEHDLSLFPSAWPSLSWVHLPPKILDSRGRQRPRPEKFRVTMNVTGFDKKNVKSAIENGKLVVTAKQEDKCQESGDFHTREFRKSFDIPPNAISDQMTSFITPAGTLVVEMPLKVEEKKSTEVAPVKDPRFDFDEFFASSFLPKIKDCPDGTKKIEMQVDVKNFKPENVHVSLKDNELIVKAESSNEDEGRLHKCYYYKQVTLPPGTDVEHLKSTVEDGKLDIVAPYILPAAPMIGTKKGEVKEEKKEDIKEKNKEEVKEVAKEGVRVDEKKEKKGETEKEGVEVHETKEKKGENEKEGVKVDEKKEKEGENEKKEKQSGAPAH